MQLEGRVNSFRLQLTGEHAVAQKETLYWFAVFSALS